MSRTLTVYAHPLTGPVAAAVPFGHIDLAFGARDIEAVRAEIGTWATKSIQGLFFDQAPTSPYSIGPVALAVRAARRHGFDVMLVNPGRATDGVYRGLGATLCTFEGPFAEYLRGTPDGVRAGDAHLVHSVPGDQIGACLRLMSGRGASWGVVTTERCLVPTPAARPPLDTVPNAITS